MPSSGPFLAPGTHAPADCGGVPCPTGDDAHTGGGEDCTGLTGEARTTCEQGHHTHDGPPPIDPRSGAPFTPADMAMYQKYIDECEATEGVLSEGSIAELIIPPHNFTRVQVEELCKDGAEHPAP